MIVPPDSNTIASPIANQVENLGANQTIASVEVSSIVFGYRIMDQLSKLENISILEASPAGGGSFWILVSGKKSSSDDLQAIVKTSLDGIGDQAKAHVLDHETIETSDHSLLEALYSLSAQKLEESLLMIESDSISAVLAAVQFAVRQRPLKMIEIKISRGSRSGGHAFLTGSRSACELGGEAARTKLKTRMSRGFVEVIGAPNEVFRQQFNFSGEA